MEDCVELQRFILSLILVITSTARKLCVFFLSVGFFLFLFLQAYMSC